MKVTKLEQFLASVPSRDPGECWVWIGAFNQDGYGRIDARIDARRKNLRAHRVVFEALVGPIPPGLTIDHLCRNRPCCNPDHLEPVPRGENTMRSPIGFAPLNAAKTHCVNGHGYTPENTYVYARPGHTMRDCRICRLATVRRYQQRRAERRADGAL